jgi:non-ribosomal peptide synthetase component F
MLAIEMAGGVYCPLSPHDPQQRLHALVQQTESHCVLVHHLTKAKFGSHVISLDIDIIRTDGNLTSDIEIDRLSNVIVTSENIAYIIFTSGSTGIPKAVSNQRRQSLR